MRNLSTPVSSGADPGFSNVLPRGSANLQNSLSSSPGSGGSDLRAFSVTTRQSVMRKNSRDVSAFMDRQQLVIKQLIQSLQIYIGYREQLVGDFDITKSPSSWSVYLMHAQALQSGINETFKGKPLFGDGVQPPIRIHLEQNGVMQKFDLPDPCFSACLSIQSFLAGVAGHKLPSVKLGNACMAELFNALMEVQHGRERLSALSKEMDRKASRLSARSLKFVQPKNHSSRHSWRDRFRHKFYSLFRLAAPVNSTA